MELIESTLSEPSALHVGRRFARAAGVAEGWLAVFFAGLISLSGVVGLLSLGDWQQSTWVQRVAAILWTLGWMGLDLPYFFRLLLLAMRKRHPFALNAAVERRMLPMILRPFVGMWWLIHFGFGAAGATLVHVSTADQGGMKWLFLFLGFGLGLAANGFLMLAVCTFTSSARVRIGIWRSRILIDLLFVLIGTLLAGQLQQPSGSSKPLRSPTGIAAIRR